MADDYDATSVAPDEEMLGTDDAAMTLENEIPQLVVQLGGSKARYSKRQRQAKQAITEVSSPPRVTEWAKRLPGYGIVTGLALDLTTRPGSHGISIYRSVEQPPGSALQKKDRCS